MADQQGKCVKCKQRKEMAVIAPGQHEFGICHKCFQKQMGTMQNEKVDMTWRSWKVGFEEWLRIEKQNGRFLKYEKSQA